MSHRPVGDTLATRMRKKTRVDYSEVDYSGVEAIGMEVEIAVAVKDNGKKPKVGNTAEKKTGVKEKSTDHKKMKEGKGKQCKKEVKKELKGGKGKTSVNKKKKGEMKVRDCGNKENNNDENHEEEHTGGEILQARSLNLPTTATMVGGTYLFEGAHLTGGNTRFFLESGRCSDYVFLTQMCPL